MIRLHKYYTQTRCSSQRTKSQIPEMTYSSGNSLDYSLTFSAGIDNFFQRKTLRKKALLQVLQTPNTCGHTGKAYHAR